MSYTQRQVARVVCDTLKMAIEELKEHGYCSTYSTPPVMIRYFESAVELFNEVFTGEQSSTGPTA